VPSLAPEERIVSTVPCNGSISYTVASSELEAVPEEEKEAEKNLIHT
jgi:hypothetical protein